MAGNRQVYQAGTFLLGAASEGAASAIVLGVDVVSAGSVQLQGRVVGSGGTFQNLFGTNVATGVGSAAAIAAAEIRRYDITGLEVQIVVVTGPVTLSYQFTAG